MGVARHDGVAKNTRSSNDCAGSEQFAINHCDRIIAVAAIRDANAPGAVLRYNLGALRVMWNDASAQRAAPSSSDFFGVALRKR